MEIKKILEKLDIEYKNIEFYEEAFTHSSYANEKSLKSYERLEFLGDAIIYGEISKYIFNKNKNMSPGGMTDLRKKCINNDYFAKIAEKFEFEKYIRQSGKNGKGIGKKIGDVFESLVGAIYLDNLDNWEEKVNEFLNIHLFPEIENDF